MNPFSGLMEGVQYIFIGAVAGYVYVKTKKINLYICFSQLDVRRHGLHPSRVSEETPVMQNKKC